MLANLDGICESPDYGTCVFEAKTASSFKSGEWEDTIPDEYYLQIQHYMAVTGFRAAYIAVLIGGNTFRWKLIERDEEMISMLIAFETVFWDQVLNMTPPPMDGSDASAQFLSVRYPDSVPQSRITLPAFAEELLSKYDDACEDLQAATDKKQEAENKLKQLLGENEAGTLGKRLVTWKHVMRNALIPVITMLGLQFGFLLGGSIVVESVFNWPGLGWLLIESIKAQDQPVIQALVMLFGFEFIVINLLVDLLYAVVNPAIRLRQEPR